MLVTASDRSSFTFPSCALYAGPNKELLRLVAKLFCLRSYRGYSIMPSPTKASSEPAKASPRSDVSVEVRLIPEFGGSPSESIAEWLEKVELVCDLRGIDKPETLVPLRLTGGAFAVYQQLSQSDKRDFSKLKEALLLAFDADSFAAYEQFSTRRLRPGETVDVFIAGLRKLALLFGGLPNKTLCVRGRRLRS